MHAYRQQDRESRDRPSSRHRDPREERAPSRRKRSRSPGREPDRRQRDRSDRPERPDRPKDSHRDKHRRTDTDRRRSAEPPASSDPPTELNQREQDDIDKRAQRALAWQKLQAEKQTTAAAEHAQQEEDKQKGWNLEDEADFEDEDGDTGNDNGSAALPTPAAPRQPKAEEAADMEEGGDEIDPLDAFMADNEASVAPVKTEPAASAEEEDEVDPLDAFMMDNNAASSSQLLPVIKPDPDLQPGTSGQHDSMLMRSGLHLVVACMTACCFRFFVLRVI